MEEEQKIKPAGGETSGRGVKPSIAKQQALARRKSIIDHQAKLYKEGTEFWR
jgi:hypothetical protein